MSAEGAVAGRVSGWKEEAAGLQGDTIKITTLRKIYQRAVAVPLDSLDDMWRVSHTAEIFGLWCLVDPIPGTISRYHLTALW